MGKGDKQRGNREAKKPKADKKAVPLATAKAAEKPAGKPSK